MAHRQQQHMGRSEGDDRDLAGRDTEGREDEALDAAAPGIEEARRIQDLVDGARHQWTGNGDGGSGGRRHGGRGGAPAKGYGRGNRRPGDSGR